MKKTMRKQLITAFIFVVAVPVLVAQAISLLLNLNMQDNPDFKHIYQPEVYFSELAQSISLQFENIDQHDMITGELFSFFTNYGGEVNVVSRSGKVLYNSKVPNTYFKNDYIQTISVYGVNFHYEQSHPDYKRHIEPIIVDDQIVAVIVYLYEDVLSTNIAFQQVAVYVGVSLAAGFITLFVMMSIFTFMLTNTIINPIGALNAATKKISQGDMDFEIECGQDNEIGELCDAFQTMKTQLSEAVLKQKHEEALKNQIISIISHDLRTPMSSIKGYVEALKDDKPKDKERQNKYLKVIAQKTEMLDRLIDDLSMYSKLEAGKMHMQQVKIESDKLLEDILSTQLLDFEHTEKILVIEKPFPKVWLYVDTQRINQVFTNLIHNATKFTDQEGKIKITTQIKDDFLEVCIQDNGVGIPSEDIPHIFDYFYCGEKIRSRLYGGTGLGLAICKYIIIDHLGDIWVESLEQVGTKIFFKLPFYSE